MSQYGGEPRYSTGNLAYRGGPPAPRWDANRFANERERRTTEVDIRRESTYDEPRSSPRRAQAPVYEEERYYKEDRYGPRGSRVEKQYYEEEEFYDPRASGGAMVPFRPDRPPRPGAPPRPGLLRRQSSLDTFDRRPQRRYDDYDEYRPPAPRIPVQAPRAPSPRRSRYEEVDYREDVRIQDPGYGDGGFREYKEREWVTRRRRDSSPSRERGSVAERVTREEIREEVVEDKPFPRRGKTKMPKRLVHTRVLYDLGYPYYEENESTLIIEKALGPNNIDEIINMSKTYWEQEKVTTLRIEAPPPEIREERIFEERVTTVPFNQAPPSIQHWDNLRSPSPKSHRSRKGRSRSRGGSSSGEEVIKETIVERRVSRREISPARTEKSHRSRRHSSPSRHSSPHGTEIVERKIIETDEIDESNSVHIGPLALVRDRQKSRSDRDLKEEIRQLEAERRALRKERHHDRDDREVIKIERLREGSPSRGRGELIVADRDEIVEVRKDKRARSVKPSPGVIRAMMATLT